MAEPEAHAYTDGASHGSRGAGGYGAVVTWNGKAVEISGSEPYTTNQRMEVTAACAALEAIDEGHVVTVYSDSSYLVNCMRRGWHEKWRKNGWLNQLGGPVANRDLWERLLEAVRRHHEVRWKKVKGHSKKAGPHKPGNDRADALAVAAKNEADRERRNDQTHRSSKAHVTEVRQGSCIPAKGTPSLRVLGSEENSGSCETGS